MKLPKIYKPKNFYQLERFGKNNDGGYLVGKKSILNSKYLISFGINDDWSFEKDILMKFNNVKVFSYDDVLGFYYLIKLFILNSFRFFLSTTNLKTFILSFVKIFEYGLIKSKINFKKKKISYKDTLKITKNFECIFFKIDIEGSEYRILEDLIKIQKKINIIVIEFHNIDLHKDKIIKFIRNLKLELTHIHPNNFSIPDKNGNPTVVEFTFERYPVIIGKKNKLPNPKDMKCNPNKPDYILRFV